MNYLLPLIPALPFAGFFVLALLGRRLSRKTIAFVGTGTVGASALLSLAMALEFTGGSRQSHVIVQRLWTWMRFSGYEIPVSLALDVLSLVMILIITIIGFLIHLYSMEYMADDKGYSRFFAYMNLFVGSMLTLVLADNLLLLYLGWEGVGLCSYLLIGFWYENPANGKAARKAFIVTRIGDTAMALGVFLLFTELGTLNIQDLMHSAQEQWPIGSNTAILAAALLLGGALGKSAQLPLQVWLPDAMAGPTPVSALIHAATMVTAGVYLIARTHVLFELAPVVQHAIAFIGTATLLVAGISALAQRDIKRVLAYSTISQLGYMFLALGVGAWSAAIFHLVTHAFFKALLFLGAGAVILAQHHEQDMFKMGGLRRSLPITFWTFLIGSASLSAFPLVTAGFYSKDMILWEVWASPAGGKGLWFAGLIGAFITTLYTFRMVFLTFFGDQKTAVGYRPGRHMTTPLIALAVLSIIGGFVELPPLFGDTRLFSNLLQPVLPLLTLDHADTSTEMTILIITEIVQFSGIFIAYLLYMRHAGRGMHPTAGASIEPLRRFMLAGWNVDALYDRLFMRPFDRLAEICKSDFVDSAYTAIASTGRLMAAVLARTQTGNIRWYAMGMVMGAIVFLGIVLFYY